MNDKKMAKNWFDKGVDSFTKGRCDMSISNFSSAIQLDPEFELVYLSRGAVYTKTDKIDSALADFAKAIELNPKHAQAYHLRGLAYLKLGNPEKAIDDFDKAIELNPLYGVAYYNRGTAHSELGNMERAGKDWDIAARLGEQTCKDLPMTLHLGGEVLQNIGRGKRRKIDCLVTPEFKSWPETEISEEAT